MNFKNVFKLTKFKVISFLILFVLFQIIFFQSDRRYLAPCGGDVCLVSYDFINIVKIWIIDTLEFSLFLIFIILLFSFVYYFFKKK